MANSKQAAASKMKNPVEHSASVKETSALNGKNNDKALTDAANNNPQIDEISKLDQIRDMLFGEHVEILQNKYQTLDQDLDQSISLLRKEFTASAEELKNRIDDKFDHLQKRLQSEASERAIQNDALNTNLATVSSDIQTKIDLEAKRMDQALKDQYEESMRQLNNMVASLQDAKVDRKSLAVLFSQFAKELEGS